MDIRKYLKNKNAAPFLPTNRNEMRRCAYQELDILLISGDAYVDHPSFGIAIIARLLEACGYRVGILPQPDITNPENLKEMGRPRLFCGISSGNMDSMVANRTPNGHKRDHDAYSENGKTGLRPDRAVVRYCEAVKQAFPGLTIVIGGIEASLRRCVHYDFWQDKIKPSILLDSKADLLIFGMGERAIIELCQKIENGEALRNIRGTAIFAGANESADMDFTSGLMLPSYEECKASPTAFLNSARIIEDEANPFCAKTLFQMHQKRCLKLEPPAFPLSTAELDAIYALSFTKKPHPKYKQKIPAYEMIQNSITVVRGCMGGCSFCSLGLHQGKFLSCRSLDSVLKEVKQLVKEPFFRGTISDLGGPSANAYGCLNGDEKACKSCKRPSCLFPKICPHFHINEKDACRLLDSVSAITGVKHVFIASGLRMDIALKTPVYLQKLIEKHVSGLLKVAPEHLSPKVLNRMRKPGPEIFFRFCAEFEKLSKKIGKEQYIVPYFISSFPGCTNEQMQEVNRFLRLKNWNPQQIQDFTPLPMTAAAAMYHADCDYYNTKEKINTAKNTAQRRRQRKMLNPRI